MTRKSAVVAVGALAITLAGCGNQTSPQAARSKSPHPGRPGVVGTIAYSRVDRHTGQHSIWTVDVTARLRQHALADNGLEPSWSPDGSYMVYAKPRLRRPDCTCRDLYLIAADGSDKRQLTGGSGDSFAPMWSPDGRSIAYTHSVEAGARSEPEEIAVMSAGGGDVRTLTRLGEIYGTVGSWSPDGRQLVVDSADGLWVLNADGTNLHRLTPRSFTSGHGEDSDPVWSPTSDQIAFRRDPSGRGTRLRSVVYTINSDGTGLARSSPHGAAAYDQAWSPDGTHLAYVVLPQDGPNRGTCSDRGIGISRPDGTDYRELAAGNRWIASVDWAPDGQHLGYDGPPAHQPCKRDGYSSDVFVVGLDGTAPVDVTTPRHADEFSYALWRPAVDRTF